MASWPGIVTLARAAASDADRRRPIAQAGWDRFRVTWECLSGIRRYGPGLRGIELIHKTGRTRRQRKTRQRSVPEEDSLLTPHRAGTNVIAPAFMQ